MKKNMIWTNISIAVLVLQCAAEVLAAACIIRLDMLPDRYIGILFAILFLMFLGISLLMLWRSKKAGAGEGRRITACVLALLIVCGCGILAKVTSDIYDTMHTITALPVVGETTRNVYVLAGDPAQTIQDAAGYTFAIVENYDDENTQGAIATIEQELGSAITVVHYDTVPTMAAALYAEKVDALILNGAYVDILEENELYRTFSEKTRVLYEAVVLTEEAPATEPTEEATEAPKVEADVTNTPFAVYISGSDTRSQMLDVSRSDVNILAVVNPVTKQVLLINTPRDYYVPNPAGGGVLDKLTHCGIYGVECSIEALENLYSLDVQYYGQLNFTGFETLIDAIGGVTVYADESFNANGVHWIQKGENHLYGEQALFFARERYRVSGGDNGRGKNQMKIIKAVIEKMTSGTTIITNYAKILDSMEGMFKTSLTTEDISKLVKMQLTDMAAWNVVTYATIGTGGSNVTYSAPGENLYVMYMNEKAVDYGSQLAQRVLSGETLTQEDMKLPE